MQETGKLLEVIPDVREQDFEFLVSICARETNALHAQINGHRNSSLTVLEKHPDFSPNLAGVLSSPATGSILNDF